MRYGIAGALLLIAAVIIEGLPVMALVCIGAAALLVRRTA